MKNKFAIPFPEAGEDGQLEFTIETLEALENEYGADYVRTVFHGLAGSRVSVMRKCVELAAPGVNVGELLSGPLNQVADRIADALMMRLSGKLVTAESLARWVPPGDVAE